MPFFAPYREISAFHPYPDHLLKDSVNQQVEIVGYSVEINLGQKKLYLWESQEGGYVIRKEYPVAVGSPEFKTSEVRGAITEIIWNPEWIPPKDSYWAKDAKDTPPGPENPLGKIKMRFYSTLYVHGTNAENSIGRAASHGCIRMKNQDVQALASEISRVYAINPINESYYRNCWESTVVKLRMPVPVKVTYELIDIRGDMLVIHPDIYQKRKELMTQIMNKLTNANYDVIYLDTLVLEKQLAKLGATTQLLPIESIFINQTPVHLINTKALYGPLSNPLR